MKVCIGILIGICVTFLVIINSMGSEWEWRMRKLESHKHIEVVEKHYIIEKPALRGYVICGKNN